MTQEERLARSVGGRGGHEGPEVPGPSPTSSHPYATRKTGATPRRGLWTLPRPQPVIFLLIKNPEQLRDRTPTRRHASRLLHFHVSADNETDHPREVIEAALAHVVQDKVEAAYAQSDLFERRWRLMDDWSSAIETM